MVTLRKRVRSDESSRNSSTAEEKNPLEAPIVGGGSRERASKSYEQARDERIKENLLRMQKLGILDLTQKLKSRFESSKPARKETPKPKSPASVPLPPRRSSRLQRVTPSCNAESRKHGENSAGKTKILRQDDNEARVPSGARRAKVLLVSEDGVVHFAHHSNPKSVAVPRLSSARKSDPKHTAATENSTGETKILRQNGDDAAVPSGAKRAKILLVSEDGVVHFAHECNPKSGVVPWLSSDRESDPNHTAAPENCSNSTCFGERRAQALVTPSQSEVKPSMVPRQSSDNVIHASFHYMPEPVMPATSNPNDSCNGELGNKATGIGAVSEPKKDVEAHLCSDSIYSVASSGKMKFSGWICDRTAGERDDVCDQEKATETFKQVEGEGFIQGQSMPSKYSSSAKIEVEVVESNTPRTHLQTNKDDFLNWRGILRLGMKAWERANAFTSKFPFFTKEMTYSYIVGDWLYIPSGFRQRYFPKGIRRMALKSPDGTAWKVSYFGEHLRGKLFHGWGAFARSHNLAVGDFCVFELVDKKTLRAQIFRVVE